MNTLITVVTILTSLPSLVIGYADQYDLKAFEHMPKLCDHTGVTFNFSYSYIRNIGKEFISSPVIACIDLESNNIDSVENGSFSGVPNLRILRLSKNNIASTDLFSFGDHKNLRELHLDSQTSRSYCCTPLTIRGSYPNLRYLDLKNNGIYNINSNNRNPFPALDYIDLSDNYIEKITPNEILSNTLMVLNLNNNRLTSIYLKNLGNLTVLTLDYNKLQCVDDGDGSCLVLSQLWNLKYLSLKHNNIRSISAYAFSLLFTLEYLDLSSNELSTLEYVRFESPFLSHLILNDNSFNAISQVSSSKKLKVLSLSFNQITNISNDDLSKFQNLTSLILTGNNITTIQTDTFYYQNSLENLWLDRNNLSSLPKGWYANLRNLKTLNLSHNNFTTLESIFYSNYWNLREVYLQDNPLAYIAANMSAIFPANATLYFIPPV